MGHGRCLVLLGVRVHDACVRFDDDVRGAVADRHSSAIHTSPTVTRHCGVTGLWRDVLVNGRLVWIQFLPSGDVLGGHVRLPRQYTSMYRSQGSSRQLVMQSYRLRQVVGGGRLRERITSRAIDRIKLRLTCYLHLSAPYNLSLAPTLL